MIIGNGNIARVLKDRDDVVFFASGVSDSGCCDDKKFDREKDLLLQQDPSRHLVYFSSLSTYYSNNAYNLHKLQMERLVKHRFQSYTIIRIGALEWVNNPTTILNVFRGHVKRNTVPVIMNAFRNVLSLNEFLYWIELIPVGKKNEMNITGRLMTVEQIWNEIKEGKL